MMIASSYTNEYWVQVSMKGFWMDSQSLRRDAIAASLIPHCTGWSVSISTVMLFPSTLGLSLISLTTNPAKWRATSSVPAMYQSYHHFLDHWNSTSNYTTKWHSTALGLGGRVGGVRSGNVISLPATKTFRIFLSSLKICEYTFTPNSLSHHSNWHPSVS